MKDLFKKAHQLTKEIKKEYPEVDYRFQFSLCLAYLQEKGENNMKSIEEKLIDLGYKIWEKKNEEGEIMHKRIYINDVSRFAEKVGYKLHNPKGYKRDKMWFNCLTGNFNYVATGKSTINVLESMTKLL